MIKRGTHFPIRKKKSKRPSKCNNFKRIRSQLDINSIKNAADAVDNNHAGGDNDTHENLDDYKGQVTGS